MSVKSKLDKLMKSFSDSADKLDESTKNIAKATSRVTYEVAKSQTFHEKYNIPLNKYQQIMDFTQTAVDICTNYIPQSSLCIEKMNAGPGADALQFEQFEAKAISQLDKCEKEIVKLKSLNDVINQISEY